MRLREGLGLQHEACPVARVLARGRRQLQLDGRGAGLCAKEQRHAGLCCHRVCPQDDEGALDPSNHAKLSIAVKQSTAPGPALSQLRTEADLPDLTRS